MTETREKDGDAAFSDSAPARKDTQGFRGQAVGAESEDDLVFTDEVGAKPLPKAPAAAPATTPPGGSPSSSGKNAPATRSSDRLPKISDGALEPPRKRRGPSDSSGSYESPVGSARGKIKKEDFPEIKVGAVFQEYAIVAPAGTRAGPGGPSPETDEPGLRVFKVEKKGRTSTLCEQAVAHPALANELAARAERLVSVRHDDLEPVFAAGRSRAGVWFVVEPRTSLRASVAAKGPLTEREALAALRGAARGLVALHARNLAHGDPSPQNLILDIGADGSGSVKLGSPARARPGSSPFQAGPIPGDPRYAAPEVLDGVAPSTASDVFTLALAYVHLVTGKEPVEATGSIAALVARSKLKRTAPDLAALSPASSPGARALYGRMTDPDPARRPQPGELVALLDAFIDQGKAPEPQGEKPPARLPRPAVPKLVAALIFACALLAALYAVASVLGKPFQDPTLGVPFEVPAEGR